MRTLINYSNKLCKDKQTQWEMECPSVIVVTKGAITFTNHVIVATRGEIGLAKPSESYLTHV